MSHAKFKTFIAGTFAYDANLCFEEGILSSGSKLKLKREPNNPYDSNATLVRLYHNRKYYKLGYIPKNFLQSLNDSDLLDNLDARVSRIKGQRNFSGGNNIEIVIEIFVPISLGLLQEKYVKSPPKKSFERAKEHIREAAEFSNKIFGSDKIVKEFFFSLSPKKTKEILKKYGKLYGNDKREYAEAIFERWKSGSVKMSGLVAKRLFSLLPQYMPQEQKFKIVEVLWRNHGPSSRKTFYMDDETSVSQIVDDVKKHLDDEVNSYYIDDNLTEQFQWLAENDSIALQSLKNHFLLLEKGLLKDSSCDRLSLLISQLKSSNNYQKIRQTFVVGKHEVILEMRRKENPSSSNLTIPSSAEKSTSDNGYVYWVIFVGVIIFILAISK